jgi:D-alanyl-D-alanine carboxypeptidase/D-alanyl-D-alanine-endopeptidase (penicillin-binding protein 4)
MKINLLLSRIIVLLFSFGLLNSHLQGRADSQAFCSEELSTAIDNILADSEKTAHWGIMIQPWFSQQVLYQRNAEKFFIPASNVKLFTTAIAHLQLNPQFQILTPVYSQGTPPHLEQLHIIGKGDPSLTSNDLEQLAATLVENEVRSIETIVLETGYFSTPSINSTWEWEDVYAAYGTAVNDLILDENAVTLTLRPQGVGEKVKWDWNNYIAASQWDLENQAITAPANTEYQIELQRTLGRSQLQITGKLPQRIKTDVWQLAIPNPDHYFRDHLLAILANHGIEVNQVNFVESESIITLGEEVMTFTSPPLRELMQEINRNSNNLYAEALIKILRAQTETNLMQQQLTQLGIPPQQYQFFDGSGLSRRNLVTPSAIAQLLQAMLRSENAEIFRSSLAVAGSNGTLANRFQSTPLQGNLQGKTGTLTGISALSGYVTPPHHPPLVFSILINHSQLPASQQREKIDAILLLLSRLQEDCSQKHNSLKNNEPLINSNQHNSDLRL